MPPRSLAFAAVLLAIAGAASAGDGVIEINQACAAVGCFAGDSAGFPVSITASGSYRLTSNLVVGSALTNVIESAASGVTIDLGGFAIRGPNTCNGEPVTSCTTGGSGAGIVTGARNQVLNGSIEGMGVGIATDTDTRVRDVIVSQSVGNGIDTSRGTAVHDSSIIRNGGIGVRANSGGGHVEVSGCTIRGNGGAGIVATDALVIENRIQNNASFALTGGGDIAYGLNQIANNNGGVNEVANATPIACNLVGGGQVCPP